MAVFIDSCFWHGCRRHVRFPKTRVEYWRRKIEGNVRRDRRNVKELKRTGWTVVRIWEHELASPARALAKLTCLLGKRSQRGNPRGYHAAVT